jgi:molecular chaperone DnaK (HSP70)
MSDNATKAGPEPSERTAIGITFGNSNSSIAYLVDDKAEVIANEDGGENSFRTNHFISSWLSC